MVSRELSAERAGKTGRLLRFVFFLCSVKPRCAPRKQLPSSGSRVHDACGGWRRCGRSRSSFCYRCCCFPPPIKLTHNPSS